MFALFRKQPRWYHYALLCILAFCVRAATFYYFVQHEERYCQPDSNDYHTGALCIAYGYGMSYPQGRPMFWRTPGYPWYLSKFYDTRKATNGTFPEHRNAHIPAIWLQIIICSLLPLLAFHLAWTLTHTLLIAWLTALISVIHLGFVLASTFLLTDGIAVIFFTLFLILLYKALRFKNENALETKAHPLKHTYLILIAAALTLGLYTWIRPMGQFIALLCTFMILLSAGRWSTTAKKAACFFLVFLATIFPWCWRNYQLTKTWFFCPLFGLYLNAFNAPKILARVENIPLKDAHHKLSQAAHEHITTVVNKRQRLGDRRIVCTEAECMHTAWPLIAAHPGYFVYDWVVEACKTMFDLYASQLVAFAGNCFKWDPLVEYLDEKIKKCLYEQPMSWSMRAIAWIEFISAIMLWIGIIGGLLVFVVQALWRRDWKRFNSYGLLWLKTGIFMGVVAMQTGGFGYARLRLPVELLMLILALTFWWWMIHSRNKTII
jgi:hypothetical protein